VSKKFYCPNVAHHIRTYITACQICQLFKKGKSYKRPFQKRINLNTPGLTKVSMDIKHMPKAGKYSYFLLLMCEVSNFIVVQPLKSCQAAEIVKTLFHTYSRYFGTPTHIICDQDPAFTSSLVKYMTQQYGTHLVFISPTNHKSLLAEHGIKSLSSLLTKHLDGFGKDWPFYLDCSMLSYNSYSSPNLAGLSPAELALGRQNKVCPPMEITPQVPVTGTYKEYHSKLQAQLKYFREQIQKFRDERTELMNAEKEMHFFSSGQIVYLYQPKGSILQTGSRKIQCHFVGPLVIYKTLAPNQFILMSLDGKIYPHLIEETRLKPGYIRTSQGNVSTLAELKRVINMDIC
jgi:hypothetical protein